MRIIHAHQFLSLSITEKLKIMLSDQLKEKGQKLQNTEVPEGWLPAKWKSNVLTSEQFTSWYSRMILKENTVREGGVCYQDADLVTQAKKIINHGI